MTTGMAVTVPAAAGPHPCSLRPPHHPPMPSHHPPMLPPPYMPPPPHMQPDLHPHMQQHCQQWQPQPCAAGLYGGGGGAGTGHIGMPPVRACLRAKAGPGQGQRGKGEGVV